MKDLYKYISESILDDDDVFLDNMEKDVRWIDFIGSEKGYMEVFDDLMKIDSNIMTKKSISKNKCVYESPVLSKSDNKKDIYVLIGLDGIEKTMFFAKGTKSKPVYAITMYKGVFTDKPKIYVNNYLKHGGIEKASMLIIDEKNAKCVKLPKEYHWIYDCCEKYIK